MVGWGCVENSIIYPGWIVWCVEEGSQKKGDLKARIIATVDIRSVD